MSVQGYLIIDFASTQRHFFNLLYCVRGLQDLSPTDHTLTCNAVRETLVFSALRLKQVYAQWQGSSEFA